MRDHFKILEFKEDKAKVLGKYPVIFQDEFGCCDIPILMTIETTIRKLEKIYPKINFKEVKLSLVILQRFQTNNS